MKLILVLVLVAGLATAESSLLDFLLSGFEVASTATTPKPTTTTTTTPKPTNTTTPTTTTTTTKSTTTSSTTNPTTTSAATATLAPLLTGTRCEDVKVESVTFLPGTVSYNDGRRVTSMTLSSQLSLNLCIWGLNFGFTDKSVYATLGCRGFFKVCYELAQESTSIQCNKPFTNDYGYCVLIEKNTKRKYNDAAAKCAEYGGRLIVLGDVVYSAAGIKDNPKVKGRKFHIGGGSLDTNLVTRIAQMFKLSASECGSAIKRFSGTATVSDYNFLSAVSSQCPSLDFQDTQSFALVGCNEKLGYICEQVPKEDSSSLNWTPWINSRRADAAGDYENLFDIAKAIDRGLLNILNLKLCKVPLAVQCRAVGTLTLYDKSNTYGLKLDKACDKEGIKCYNSQQSAGKTCPDFEVRFQCPQEVLKDCAVESVRKACEQERKECVMSVLGAECVQKQRQRTGKEKIGCGVCNINSQTYQVFECASRGDPHYYTLDGIKFDFQGECSYNLISTCNNYVATADFPDFSVVSMNQKSDPRDLVSLTKAFIFIVHGIRYKFTRGKCFVNDLERNPLGYKDDHITINAQPKGSSVQLTINTEFCVVIKWDNKQGLYIYVPESYKNFVCGLCGNFDGNPSNDMTIPGSNVPVSADKLGRYYMVGGEGANGCVDVANIPNPCTAESRQLFSDRKYCGIFNPDGDSPFTAAVLYGSDTDCYNFNKAKLRDRFNECIEDHCWMFNFTEIGRCHEMEAAIEEMRLQLAIFNSTLDSAWRKYAGCENSSEILCGGRLNTEYSSSYLLHCQDTCADPDKSVACCNQETSQGCICKKGFFLDANLNCVSAKECDNSCNVLTESGERVHLQDGATLVLEPCRKTVTCENGISFEKVLQPCSENAECLNGGLMCVCRQGFKGNGTLCVNDISCREGYTAFGAKCYKLVRDKLEWHKAAINCGADGAHLARYDTDQDEALAVFIKKVLEIYLISTATSRNIRCGERSNCQLPKNQAAISARVKDSAFARDCEGKFKISDDRFTLTVTAGCRARNFIVETVDAKYYFLPQSLTTWIGGCTQVLGPNKRNGRIPFQVDPPRRIDLSTLQNSVGCFQANFNAASRFAASPNPDCKAQLPSICEYDNTKQNSHDPNDFKGIPKKCNHQEAIDACAQLGRPLAKIINKDQLAKAQAILSMLGDDGWLSLRWKREDNDYLWPDGQKLTASFSNFPEAPQANVNSREYHCASINKKTGYWYTEGCEELFFPLCGPPVESTPTVYSPFYAVDGFSSVSELRQKLQRLGTQSYICPNPVEIECSAVTKFGQWVTNRDQQGTTITCRSDSIKCVSGQELDCTCFRVRFLCPQDGNQCDELLALSVNPCDGGRVCFPISNHYVCQCPPGSLYNEHAQTCSSFCGECSAWGDPHYTTFSGKKYNFMGTCKYKFTGICNLDQFGTSPSFDVLTKNSPCGSIGASCISGLEVQLRNIPVVRNGAEIRENFNFVVAVGASRFKLNDMVISQMEYSTKGVFTTVVKSGYFELSVYPLDLNVLLSGSKLKVQVPGQFKNKMCGLCGDCGTDLFKLRNGSSISVPARNLDWDSKVMAVLASDWKVFDPASSSADCQVPVVLPDDNCPEIKRVELAKSNLCGVFLDNSSSIQECFARTNLDRQHYFKDCMYDACIQADPQKSVCTMVKAFAQECSSKGVPLDWRRESFCPMDCGKKVYRADASCEPTCGRRSVSQQVCQEEPEEGCVCSEGQMRQGDHCVPPQNCGCVVYLLEDTVTWNLAPGESMLLPKCLETVDCVVNQDGTSTLVHRPFSLPVNSVCNSQIPPSVECATGFSKDADNVTCKRIPAQCVNGFYDVNGFCLKTPDEPKTWRGALQACNEEDGTLISIDSDAKIISLMKIFKEKQLPLVYISGRVRAVVVQGAVVLKPVLSITEYAKVEWANFRCSDELLELIKLSSAISVGSIPAEGLVLSVAVRMTSTRLIFEAVLSDAPANFICEERKVTDEETEFYGPCNNDVDMNDGDQERRYDMIMNPDCLVCPKPIEIRCDVNPNRAVEGSVEGTCDFGANGEYYSCNEGLSCIDKGVSTRCARDADECATGRHDCPVNTRCVNTVGGYSCKCTEQFPLMVNGKCQASNTCTMSGPATPMDYVYNLQGFSGIPGQFDYDCKYKLAYICDNSNYNASSGLPYISFYVMSSRDAGALVPSLSGAIYCHETGTMKRWGTTPGLLSQGLISFAENDGDPILTSLGFLDKDIQTRFQFIAPGTLLIRHSNNYFKATISFPTRIQIEFSDDYKNLICGACKAKPDYTDAKIVLTDQEVDEISAFPEAPCSQRVVPTLPPPITSVEPVTPSQPGEPATPSQHGEPFNPSLPGEPVNPSQPEEPVPPSQPEEPATPSQPGEPFNPSQPGEPVTPSQPEEPVPPSQPKEPATPSQPIETTQEQTTPRIIYGSTILTGEPTYHIETLPPDTEVTQPPLPFETLPSTREGTLLPVTDEPQTTVGVVTQTEPTVTTTPIPIDHELDDCKNEAIVACGALSSLCGVPQEKCRASLCSGKLSICSYLATDNFESCTLTSELKAFIQFENCDQLCGANMEFKYTTRSQQPTCIEPILSTSVSESSDVDYTFACVCDEGFVLSQTECVRESDCGCVMTNGAYKPPGIQWRSDDCREVRTCLGNNNVNTQVAPCGSNTECVVGERGPECHCLDGLFGNPDMPQGCGPGEKSLDGSKTCYNYVLPDGQNDTRCDCNMGFVSNCEDCEDIDECKEGLHECDLTIRKCINVPGGYQCGCADGFVEKNAQCVDINECTQDKDICKENSQCRNTEGSYECICCAGYLWNPESLSCERELMGFPSLPVNASCCALCNNDALCEESEGLPSPYCYTDEKGQSSWFVSYKRMYQELCLNNQPLNKDGISKGRCPSVNPNPIVGPGSPPAPHPHSCDEPSLCAAFPPPPPSLAQGQVCGPRNAEIPRTYPSYCDMVKAICKSLGGPRSLPRDATIKANPGPCVHGEGPPKPDVHLSQPLFTPWSPYSKCLFKDTTKNCGEGIQVKNRHIVPHDDLRPVREVEDYETTDRRPCFEPCLDEVTGNPVGECPEPSFCNEVDPVCGSLGSGAAKEYNSECELNVAACVESRLPHKLYSGSCDLEDGAVRRRYCEQAGPVQVAVKYDIERDGVHCVGEPVSIGSCGDLLCEGEAGTCCTATSYEQVQVSVQCYSLETKLPVSNVKHIYISAKECKCQVGSP